MTMEKATAQEVFGEGETHGFWQRVYHANLSVPGSKITADGLREYALQHGIGRTELQKYAGDIVSLAKEMPPEWLREYNLACFVADDHDPVFSMPSGDRPAPYRKRSDDKRLWAKLLP